MQLLDPDLIIRVRVWSEGQWRNNLFGIVIGIHEGIAGVLLDGGEYIDVPVTHLKEIARWKEEPKNRNNIAGVTPGK